jgi:aryl-alcohol dehydrogenase-like predicted oxidoreductase
MFKLPTRSLGKNGPQLPRLGLGLMNASGTYGLAGSDANRLAFLDEAYKMGEVFWDTGTFSPRAFLSVFPSPFPS